MKKQSYFPIIMGIAVVAISILSEHALSIMSDNQWSNYVHSWNIELKKHREMQGLKKSYAMGKPRKPQIAICDTPR